MIVSYLCDPNAIIIGTGGLITHVRTNMYISHNMSVSYMGVYGSKHKGTARVHVGKGIGYMSIKTLKLNREQTLTTCI